MSRIAVGRLLGVFGIRGEFKCRPTPAGTDAFAPGKSFWLGPDASARGIRCASARRHHDRLLVGFEGIATPEEARAFVGADLYAEEAEPASLGVDEYLDADLIGLRLIALDGSEVARVVAVRHFPAQDCLLVEPGGALVPMVKAFIRRVDVAAGTIDVDLPPGLLDLA